ncbi:uncharacterized protein A4U43_C07F38020 [Asparagus officinalis]|uniref:DYW domain-containing protein n=2 Tax=Asparagus officinalis TaxID=4686 RepID=A0A5P1EK24_ASPOF|nr:uncharacterized protein A4U43_C07F38020 [Asparagus officinalis]
MLVGGVEPNESVFVNVISACAYLGALEQGRWIESYLRRKGVRIGVRIGTALIDMYLTCGCVERAFGIFDGLKEKNVMAWSAMIAGLAVNGRGREALRLFAEMENDRVLPNEVTFIGVLNACSHCRLVDEGLKHFKSMSNVYGLKPNVRHYCCLVDLYGRSGMLDRAQEVIKEMPMKPNSAVWGALLNSCRIHGNTLLGEKIGKELLELEPNNSGRYMLLSNIYAANGKWEEVVTLRRMMKENGVDKTPGSSVIELEGSVHEFIAGDNFHPDRREVYRMVDRMMVELKSAGYKPETDQILLDMDEEEKETALCHHSEKLAIAFGLIKSDPATTIRITKNLRICNDCHAAMKLISKIYDREIVVRDRSRFHHFRGASCSCGDFW